MPAYSTEQVLSVHHWNDHLFSFKTTRPQSLKFKSGQFIMVGLEIDAHKVSRAYSIVSSIYDEYLEFLSIRIENGRLTTSLQKIKEGDQVLISNKPTGTLITQDLNPGKNLYLLSTGTGIAPFLSIIQDLDTYEQFEKIILVHSVRCVNDLAYNEFIAHQLSKHPYLGHLAADKLIYYPTVTREPFKNTGRIPALIESNKLFKDISLPDLNPLTDRVMICGNQEMLKETKELLNSKGFHMSKYMGDSGDYIIEHAFVEK